MTISTMINPRQAVGLTRGAGGQCCELIAHRRQVLAEQAAIGSKLRDNMPSLFGTAGAKRLGHPAADLDEVGEGAFHVAKAAADIGHRHTFFEEHCPASAGVPGSRGRRRREEPFAASFTAARQAVDRGASVPEHER
jgi:hypothetical protein